MFQEALDKDSSATPDTDGPKGQKIRHPIASNFLRHVYSESVPDLARITVAEAEGDFDTLIQYLEGLKNCVTKWIGELKHEKESKG